MSLPGSGGGTSSAGSSKAYIPQQQPAADQGYQNLTSQFYNLGQTGLNAFGGVPPSAQAWPNVQATTNNVLNNAYAPQAVGSATAANEYFNNGVLPNVAQGSQSLAGLANIATGQVPGVLAASQNPAYAAAGGAGANMTGGFQGAAGKALGDVFNPNYLNAIGAGNTAAGKQFGAGDTIRNMAFDPQQALYSRTQARLADQIGAGNANSGLAGTPYGESVRGNVLSNFNLDWNDRQLQRGIAGGQAASGLDTAGISDMLNPATAATSAAATDIGAAGQAGQSALSSLLTPANAQVVAALQGTNALQGLSGIANQDFTGANNLLTSGASGINTFGQMPYNTYQGVQGNNFGALQNEIALGNTGLTLPQQTLNDLQSYLGLGQAASGRANEIGTTNFNQLAQGAQGLGGLAGLANSGGGGIGSLIGSTGSGITDFGGGGAALGIPDVIGTEAATSGSGILGALAPLGFSA